MEVEDDIVLVEEWRQRMGLRTWKRQRSVAAANYERRLGAYREFDDRSRQSGRTTYGFLRALARATLWNHALFVDDCRVLRELWSRCRDYRLSDVWIEFHDRRPSRFQDRFQFEGQSPSDMWSLLGRNQRTFRLGVYYIDHYDTSYGVWSAIRHQVSTDDWIAIILNFPLDNERSVIEF